MTIKKKPCEDNKNPITTTNLDYNNSESYTIYLNYELTKH